MFTIFKETWKVLGIRKMHTSSYHPESNGTIERWHSYLHMVLSYYMDAANTNWDTHSILPYGLPGNAQHGVEPLFLLHGRQMSLPINDLKAKVSNGDLDLNRWIEKLKASLRSVRAAKKVPSKQ
jgi:hypothetical protein